MGSKRQVRHYCKLFAATSIIKNTIFVSKCIRLIQTVTQNYIT